MAIAGMVAAALLGREFDARAALLVLGVTGAADLDALLGLVVLGAHRAAFHTLLLPLGAVALVALDDRRETPWLRGRYGGRGVRLAYVTAVAFAVGAVGPDLFYNGANPFYPLHDQFYVLNGKIEVSDERGLIQTFVDLSPPEPGGGGGGGGSQVAVGSTQDVQYSSGVDPDPSSRGSEDTEHVFPVARSGFQLLILLTGTGVTAARLWLNRRLGPGDGQA
jgi:hypothetical protein